METVAEVGEFGLIERLHQVIGEEGRPPGLVLGIGDDAALLRPSAGVEWAVTCDVLLEGRHFLPQFLRGAALGRRAIEVNLSDLAAMGAQPRYAFAALGLRGDTAAAEVVDWYRGFTEALRPWGAGLAGGNITRVDGAQFISLTLIGEVALGRALRRDGAHQGDAIMVTGYPGQAAAGLALLRRGGAAAGPLVDAHLAPRARVAEARALVAGGLLSAAIDLSDGLPGDLSHLCRASGVGARLWTERLPQSPALRAAGAALGQDPLAWVLGPSDDYELLLTCPQEKAGAVLDWAAEWGKVPLHQIGVLTGEVGRLELVGADGSVRLLDPRGWDHFAA